MDVRRILALAMSGIYVLAGALIGFTDVARDVIPRYRPAISGVLIGYGVLRFVLWWRKHKQSQDVPQEPS